MKKGLKVGDLGQQQPPCLRAKGSQRMQMHRVLSRLHFSSKQACFGPGLPCVVDSFDSSVLGICSQEKAVI